MTQHLTQQELESYLWGAAKLLRGLVDAGDYKQYIFPLLFFKSENKGSLYSEIGLETADIAAGFIDWIRGRDVYDENKNSDTSEEHHKLFDFYHSGIVKVGPPDASLPGAGGMSTWKFKVTAQGEGTLRFEYRRSWEQGPPEKTVRWKLDVTR